MKAQISRVVDENITMATGEITRQSSIMSSTSSSRSIVNAFPTLGQLFKLVGDVTGDENPENEQILQVNDTVPISPAFVLSFNNLTYSVNRRRKMTFPRLFRHRRSNRLGSVTETTVLEEESFYTGNKKMLLNDISGEAKDGELLAVLGASGSGKSTLIDALANKIAKGSLKGTVTLNGEPLGSRLLKTISAYVMQDDLLFPMLTVEETLMFSAEFHLPSTFSKSKKNERVQALIDQLGLRDVATTIIGDEGHRGVSGGERRRVSIGADIIHNPIILFLDEPTSGLDSTSAFMVVKVLQRIAQTGSIVIMSVHQPSYRILELLDRLIFLSKGQTIYRGSPTNILTFFSDFGYPIPENENHTEFALDLIRELEESPEGTKNLIEFNKKWQIVNQNRRNHKPNRYELPLKEAITASISTGKLVSGTTSNPIWIEIIVLAKRSAINSQRMPELFRFRLGVVIFTGVILATLFWQVDNSPKGVQERLGCFAFAVSTTYYTCTDALPVLLYERYIFMRETAYNAYRRSSYVLSHSLVVLPSLVILALAFAGSTFPAIGLSGGLPGFFFYFLVMLASFWTGNSFVTLFSGIFTQVTLGYIICVALLGHFFLFCGFFVNSNRIPWYYIWMHYISLVKYPYEAVMQNEFDNKIECFVKGVEIFDNTAFRDYPIAMKEKLLQSLSSTLKMKMTNTTCVTTGNDILQQQGVTDLSKWNCLWIIFAWGFLFRVMYYFSLLVGSKNKRR